MKIKLFTESNSILLIPTAFWHSHLSLAMYIFVVVNFDVLSQASDFRIGRRQAVFLCWMQIWTQRVVSETQSPADWMPANKPTELSRIKLKTWTRLPVHTHHTHIANAWLYQVATHTHTYIHCICLVVPGGSSYWEPTLLALVLLVFVYFQVDS